MPELPEVETVCRALRRHLIGARIADVHTLVPRLRRPLDEPALRRACRNHTIAGIRRRAKYLLVDFEDGRDALLLHLGMTGAFRVCPATVPLEKHARVVWTLADGREWRYIDPRMFGHVTVCTVSSPDALPTDLDTCGVEPLTDALSPALLWQLSRRRTCPIKNLIMDQRVVVGVGNIYANEACFRAKLRPQCPAGRLTRPACARLVREIKAVLEEAILCGGTTISDFRSVDGDEGRFHIALEVYGRAGEACNRCGVRSRIRRIVQGGRSTYYCPRCQC